ncbi:MAG: NAD(P)/FAD-dependent oxidoreductase [Micromonosporaceae bacterium]
MADGTGITRIEVDVAIVGAGPTGLFAAYYAGFRGLSTAVIDALPEPGGQVTAMYPEKLIYDVAGFPAVRGRELVANLVEQAASYHPHYLLGERAETLEYESDDKPTVKLGGGSAVHCGAILITGGIGSFTPRPLPAADEFGGRGIVYFVPELEVHRGEDVVVVGGGDSAFDWALALHPIARRVTMVHRRDKFRAHAATVDRVKSLGVPIIVNAQVTEVIGDGRVEGVRIEARDEPPQVIPAQTIVAALGFTADLGPLADWGFELDKRHIKVDTTMATNQTRVFAAGDISDYPGKVRLIAVGFGEAATAVNNAAVAIDPGAHLFPGHSSNLDNP